MKHRIQIVDVTPNVDDGRYAVKTTVGRTIAVSATMFREGHSKVAAAVRYRKEDASNWDEAPMHHVGGDEFAGSFATDAAGAWVYEVLGWTDHYLTWLDGLVKKHRAGVADLTLEFEQGALLLQSHAKPAGVPAPVPPVFAKAVEQLRDTDLSTAARVEVARSARRSARRWPHTPTDET